MDLTYRNQGGVKRTPSSSSRLPVQQLLLNPYDKLTARQFNEWTTDLTDTIRLALNPRGRKGKERATDEGSSLGDWSMSGQAPLRGSSEPMETSNNFSRHGGQVTSVDVEEEEEEEEENQLDGYSEGEESGIEDPDTTGLPASSPRFEEAEEGLPDDVADMPFIGDFVYDDGRDVESLEEEAHDELLHDDLAALPDAPNIHQRAPAYIALAAVDGAYHMNQQSLEGAHWTNPPHRSLSPAELQEAGASFQLDSGNQFAGLYDNEPEIIDLDADEPESYPASEPMDAVSAEVDIESYASFLPPSIQHPVPLSGFYTEQPFQMPSISNQNPSLRYSPNLGHELDDTSLSHVVDESISLVAVVSDSLYVNSVDELDAGPAFGTPVIEKTGTDAGLLPKELSVDPSAVPSDVIDLDSSSAPTQDDQPVVEEPRSERSVSPAWSTDVVSVADIDDTHAIQGHVREKTYERTSSPERRVSPDALEWGQQEAASSRESSTPPLSTSGVTGSVNDPSVATRSDYSTSTHVPIFMAPSSPPIHETSILSSPPSTTNIGLPPDIRWSLSRMMQGELQELPDPHVPPEPTYLTIPEGIQGSLERKARGRAESLREGEEDMERESLGVGPPTPHVLSEIGELPSDYTADLHPEHLPSEVETEDIPLESVQTHLIDEAPMTTLYAHDEVDCSVGVDENPERPQFDAEGSDEEDDPFQHMGNDSMTMPGAVELDDEADDASAQSSSESDDAALASNSVEEADVQPSAPDTIVVQSDHNLNADENSPRMESDDTGQAVHSGLDSTDAPLPTTDHEAAPTAQLDFEGKDFEVDVNGVSAPSDAWAYDEEPFTGIDLVPPSPREETKDSFICNDFPSRNASEEPTFSDRALPQDEPLRSEVVETENENELDDDDAEAAIIADFLSGSDFSSPPSSPVKESPVVTPNGTGAKSKDKIVDAPTTPGKPRHRQTLKQATTPMATPARVTRSMKGTTGLEVVHGSDDEEDVRPTDHLTAVPRPKGKRRASSRLPSPMPSPAPLTNGHRRASSRGPSPAPPAKIKRAPSVAPQSRPAHPSPPIRHHHHHHHRPPPPRPPVKQPQQVRAPDSVPTEAPVEAPPPSPSASPSVKPSSLIVTRSHCSFHKISIPGFNGSPVYFIIPGCAFSDADLMKKENIVDHGVANDNDELSRRTVNFEGYRVEPEVMTVLRKLVGIDLLREEAVAYLPSQGEYPTYTKPKPSERGSPAPSVTTSLRSRPAYNRRFSSPVNKRKRSSQSSRQTEDRSTISYSGSEGEGAPKKKPRNSLFPSPDGREPVTAGRKSGGRKLNSENVAYKPGEDEVSDDGSSDGTEAPGRSRKKVGKPDADPSDLVPSGKKPKSRKRRRDTDSAYRQPKEDPEEQEEEEKDDDDDRRKSKRRKSSRKKLPAASPAPGTSEANQTTPVSVGGD